MLKDLRYALRALRKRPGFSFVIIITLALGIGVTSAVFSYISAFLLQPLPYREPDRLVRITSMRGNEEGRLSMLELKDLREQTTVFESVAPYIPGAQYNYSGDGPPEELSAILVSRDFFNVLGVTHLYGEAWPDNYDLERNFGVVLSYDLWRRRFGGDPNVLGRKITLDAAPFYTIYGVLPPDFNFPATSQLYRSIAINPRLPNYTDRDARNVYALARLKPGVTVEQAHAELDAFGRRLAQTYPNMNTGLSFEVKSLRDFYVGDVRAYLWLLFGAVGFVLLITCTNITSLLLSKSLNRQREIAVRTALGASRWRLLRQLLIESLLLSAVAGLVGLGTAWLWIRLLGSLIRSELPVWIKIAVDWRVLLFTVAISTLAGLVAGFVPAWQTSRSNVNELLKEGAKGSSGSHQRLRHALVVGEVALALMLLIGAGLMVKSFIRLQQTDLGFKPDRLLTLRVALPWRKYSSDDGPEKQRLFFQQLLQRLPAISGVEAAALTNNLPLSGETQEGKTTFTVEGQSAHEQQQNPYINDLRVSPEYLRVMGIPLLRGRFLIESDTAKTDRVGVINRRFANLIWPGQEAIGKRIKVGGVDSKSRWTTIVGVVGDVKHERVASDSSLDLYVSYQQVLDANMYLLLRTKVPPLSLADQATREVWASDPEQSTFNIVAMDRRVADAIWQRRMSGTLILIFAGLALALSAIGIYGVMSYTVTQRTRELGIRMAMGATPKNVLQLVVLQGAKLIGIGITIGLFGSFAVSRVLSGFLYNVSPSDPVTYLLVTLFLAVCALFACWIPARRATKVSPLVALRNE
ncbi:MAG TPA: ABC transporter permease [Pyrinomonadaceae bacterium]|jgi:putative ABC transport system permease protein|nr:ABC transporter permease [Pyrinomonadaceae bacterium]